MSDLAIILGVFLAIAIGLFALIGISAYYMERWACYSRTAEIGFPADFGLMSGCRINIDGNWVPLENYRHL